MQTLDADPPAVTVGQANADVTGADDTAIQAAVHLAANRGVNTVRIRKGTYLLKNSIVLHSGLTLTGEGDATILKKALDVESPLADDANWYQRVVRVQHPERFPVGCGIALVGTDAKSDDPVFVEATVVGRDGNTLILDRKYLGKNLWLVRGEQKAITAFRHIRAEDQRDITIAGLLLDGGVAPEALVENEGRGGGIFMQNCDRVTIRSVTLRHNNSDAISWQICEHVTVEDCRSEHNCLGMHPGSGSQYTLVRNCAVCNNLNGFYFCWGVQHGCLEHCEISGNQHYGISVGFRDSHNVIRNNRVSDNGEVGVHFRKSRFPHQSPVDDRLEHCRLENNGPAHAPLGIHIQDAPDRIHIAHNTIADSRQSEAGVGIRIEKTVRAVTLEKNTIRGFAKKIVDLREHCPPSD